MNRNSRMLVARAPRFAIFAILGCYACTRILESALPSAPGVSLVALDVVSALSFALVDGARHYGRRGMLAFAGLCVVVGNTSENLSIATGFPFGHYYFLDLMAPKVFQVPVLLGLAYIGTAYVSWMLGALLAGNGNGSGLRVVATPAIASFIMVAWDLAQDPVWATVLHGCAWRDGGPWFGVPISNYLGWYLTIFVIYLLFAVYLRRRSRANAAHGQESPAATARPAIVFYALCAAGNVLQCFRHPSAALVRDPSGQAWRTADIIGASALISVLVMGGFVVLAWARLADRENTADQTATG